MKSVFLSCCTVDTEIEESPGRKGEEGEGAKGGGGRRMEDGGGE